MKFSRSGIPGNVSRIYQVPKGINYTAGAGVHGQLTRATYSPVEGKAIILSSAHIQMMIDVSGTGTNVIEGIVSVQKSGGAQLIVLQCGIYINTVQLIKDAWLSANYYLTEGDSIRILTSDARTTGGAQWNINVSFTEFDV